MRSLLHVALLAVSAPLVLAADNTGVKCGQGSNCPEDLPCCSQYGQCGVGAYCLGGCDPSFSHSLDSCVPAPTCQDKTLKMTSLDNIQPNTKYLGDPSKADWVSSGQPVAYKDSVLMTMPQDSVGTLLASTDYVWYGKVSARLKTSRGKGVVTAFILLSDVKDEIDWEFVGVDLQTAQSNYYFQGITDYHNTGNSSVSDTFANYHTYEIDWTPDQITWSIDGEQKRQKKRSDTKNSTTNQYNYPQTPARVQLSLWPGGLPSNGKGTVDWAGGEIDWNGQDVKNNGYYYAQVTDVSIQCYDPPSGAKKSGSKSYIYNDAAGTEDKVEITDKNTVLKSLLGSGTNMSADFASSSSSASGTATAAPKKSDVATIPGLTGAGPGTDGSRGGSSDSNSNGNTGSSSSASPQPSGPGGFSQGKPSGNNAPMQGEKVLQGSIFAGLVAVAGMLLL